MCNLDIFRYVVLFYHAHVSAIRWLGVCFMIFRLVLLSGRLNVFKSPRCSCYLDGVCVAFESRFFFHSIPSTFWKKFPLIILERDSVAFSPFFFFKPFTLCHTYVRFGKTVSYFTCSKIDTWRDSYLRIWRSCFYFFSSYKT